MDSRQNQWELSTVGTSKRKGPGEENKKRITKESVKRNLRAISEKSEEKSVLEWGSCC